jgi:hypothetical protein
MSEGARTYQVTCRLSGNVLSDMSLISLPSDS